MLNPKIQALVKLQEIDTDIDRLDAEISSIPFKIEQKNKEFEDIKSTTDKEKNEIKQLQLELKNIEMEVKTKEDLVNKNKTELNIIKTNDQYSALVKQIKASQEAISDAESRILGILDSIDATQKELKVRELELKKIESELGVAIKGLEERKKQAEIELEAVKVKRGGAAGLITPSVLRKYEHIRESRDDGTAIVIIEKGACSSCHIKLPAQVENESVKIANDPESDQMVICEHCARMLYSETTTFTPMKKAEKPVEIIEFSDSSSEATTNEN